MLGNELMLLLSLKLIVLKHLRPISRTRTLLKLIQSFIGQWILSELGDKIDPRQFGALKGRSVTQNMIFENTALLVGL